MDYTLGCGCGVIEPERDDERRAHACKNEANSLRKQAERMLEVAERQEEKARRYFGGGKDCETCEEAGGWQTPPNHGAHESGWEVCPDCDGYGVTRAQTCADHEDS